LEHALLQGRKEIGITLQTLDKTRFDHGVILRQTRDIKIPDPDNITIPQLRGFAARLGASILETGVVRGEFLKGSQVVTEPFTSQSKERIKVIQAPKITPDTRHIDWSVWSADRILRYHRVIGPLWNQAVSHKRKKSSKKPDSVLEPSEVRLQLIDMQESKRKGLHPSTPGLPFYFQDEESHKLFIWTCDGHLLEVSELKVEGDVTKPAAAAARKAKLIQLDSAEKQEQQRISFFHRELR
jgi:methionyl-tRNA formyltransferase